MSSEYAFCPIGDAVKGERVLDFAYVSEDNSLFVVILTSQGNLISYSKTGNSSSTHLETRSLGDVVSEWLEPLVIALTPAASFLVLLLSNGEGILLIPISYITSTAPFTTTTSNQLTLHPISFSIVTSASTNDNDNCFRMPTSAFCFTTFSTTRTHLVFSNKGGEILIVDLHTRRLISRLCVDESVHNVELYTNSNDDGSYMLVTKFTGSQSLVPLEKTDCGGVRETLSHFNPAKDVIELNANIRFFIHKGGVCALNQHNSIVELYDSIPITTSSTLSPPPPVKCWSIPNGSWLIHYTPTVLLSVSEPNKLAISLHFLHQQAPFEAIRLPNDNINILGVIPISAMPLHLDECLLVTDNGLAWLQPNKPASSLIAVVIVDALSVSSYSIEAMKHISANLNIAPIELVQIILNSLLKDNTRKQQQLDGLISLAMELNFGLQRLVELFNQYPNSTEHLLPFLSVKCEHDPSMNHLLFDAYISKINRLKREEQLLPYRRAEIDKIEFELRHFLFRFNHHSFWGEPTDTLMTLLRLDLWSCVAILLSRNGSSKHSATVIKWLMDMHQLSLSNSDILLCIRLLDWASLDGKSIAQQLLNKLINDTLPAATTTTTTSQLKQLSRVGETAPNGGACLHLLASIRLYTNDEDDHASFNPLSCGSNCTAAILEDGRLAFWGEFTAGSLRLKNEQKKRVLSSRREELIPIPKYIELPINDHQQAVAVAVECGTEHVLVLTNKGDVFTWGVNRYGQCGMGHNQPILKPTLMQGEWGRVKSIYAGHYHSALINGDGHVCTCGWGMHGQLATGSSDDHYLLVKVEVDLFSQKHTVIGCALGYAHSLFLLMDGNIVGCGDTGNGQLGSGGAGKALQLIKVQLPEPARLIASSYFSAIAVGAESGALYVWGESPATLKMRAFLAKQQSASCSSPRKETPPKDIAHHMEVHKLCDWPAAAATTTTDDNQITSISSGFNHSALITASGQLYTWGKSMELQLGHGNKQEKAEPSLVIDPSGIKRWAVVKCARNYTTAVSIDGRCFTWGRNDKSQLGLGTRTATPINSSSNQQQQPVSAVRRIVLAAAAAKKGARLQMPPPQPAEDYNVNVPTPIPAILVSIESQINHSQQQLDGCNQKDIEAMSHHLIKHPIFNVMAVEVHLMAGDLLDAVDVMVAIVGDGGSFDLLLDKAWDLLRVHPLREVQTLALLTMLNAQFPIYNRLATDSRLCRLIDNVRVESVNSSNSSGSGSRSGPSSSSSNVAVVVASSSRRRLANLNTKERLIALKEMSFKKATMAALREVLFKALPLILTLEMQPFNGHQSSPLLQQLHTLREVFGREWATTEVDGRISLNKR